MDHDVKHLEQITERIEAFLGRHVRRLADVLDLCSERLAQGEVVQRLIDDLQQQKKQWELQRQAEASQIEQEHARLIAAWEQLEAEERRIAAQSESLRLGRNAGIVVNSLAERPTGESPPGPPAQGDENRTLVRENSATSRRQFEQLKREIRNHARRAGEAG